MRTRKADRRERGKVNQDGAVLSALRPPWHYLLLTNLSTVVERVIVVMKVRVKGEAVKTSATSQSEVDSIDLELSCQALRAPIAKMLLKSLCRRADGPALSRSGGEAHDQSESFAQYRECLQKIIFEPSEVSPQSWDNVIAPKLLRLAAAHL